MRGGKESNSESMKVETTSARTLTDHNLLSRMYSSQGGREKSTSMIIFRRAYISILPWFLNVFNAVKNSVFPSTWSYVDISSGNLYSRIWHVSVRNMTCYKISFLAAGRGSKGRRICLPYDSQCAAQVIYTLIMRWELQQPVCLLIRRHSLYLFYLPDSVWTWALQNR